MQTFQSIYDSLDKKKKSALIQKVINETEMSANTFYQKRRHNTFSKLERERISEIIGQPVDRLFPESKQALY